MEELKDKIFKAMKSDFIGDVFFDEEELEKMKENCKKFYIAANNSWSKLYKQEDICELIVLIINIAKSWDDESEGRFWTKLFGEIFDDSSISPVKFYNDFESCLNFYNKKLFRSKENKRMFREFFLLHAFAPEKSADSFIRLLWNWYSDVDVINFDYQYNDILYSKIASFLNTKFGGISDLDEDVDFDGKIYSIKASFKYLFTQDNDIGTKLLNLLFSIFDDVYFNNKYDKNSFFAEKCFKKIDEILQECNILSGHRKKHNTEHIASDYSKLYAGYEIGENENINLFISEVRAIDEEADDYLVEVLRNGTRVYSEEGYVVGKDIKRKIKRISIPLLNFIDKLDETIDINVKLYVIRDNDKILIFDSKKSLFRDFIIFKGNRETRTDNCKPEVAYYLVHTPKFNINKITNCSIKTINSFLSTIYPSENDYISTDSQQVFFNIEKKESHIVLNGKEYKQVKYQKDEIYYRFLKSIDSISLILPQTTNYDSITIIVDSEKHYPLLGYSVVKDNMFVINLSKIQADSNGIHKIMFYDVSEKKLLHTALYYINSEILFNFQQDNYMFDNNSTNHFLNVQTKGKNDDLYSFNPRIQNDKVEFDYDNGTIVIDLPYIKWRIDDGEWHYSILNKKFWCKESFLHDNCVIEIENNTSLNIELFLNDEIVEISKSGKYLLGDALTKSCTNTLNNLYLVINKDRYLLFQILNKEELSDFEIDIDKNIIDFSKDFIGDYDSKFFVKIYNENNEYEFDCKIKDIFEKNIIDGEYDVEVFLLDFFNNKKLLLSDTYIIGNPDKFVFNNSYIVLTKFNRLNAGKIKLQNTYITNLKYIREETIGSVYSGILEDKGMKYEVEIYKKDDRSLIFYFVKDKNLLSIGYDLIHERFTYDKIDDKNIISCTSCYYDIEEI